MDDLPPAHPDDRDRTAPVPAGVEPGTEQSGIHEPDDRRRRPNRWAGLVVWLAVLVVVAIGASMAFDASPWATLAAVILGAVILRGGWFFLRTVGTLPPPPPDPGTIRRVRLVYRCSVCGAEVRMTAAPSEDPEPPRHCMEDMDLVAPIE